MQIQIDEEKKTKSSDIIVKEKKKKRTCLLFDMYVSIKRKTYKYKVLEIEIW